MGIFDFRDPNKRREKTSTLEIACDLTGLRINGTPISFPTNYEILKSILGDASRIEQIKQSRSKVYLWDDLGVYCSSADPEKMLMLLLVVDNRYGLGHQP